MVERVTLLDVAQRCGVSKATASRILNDSDGSDPFSPQTRKRVLQAAHQLGYRPSHRAQALARNRSGAVGMLYFSELPPHGQLFDRFFTCFLDEIRRDTYHVVFIPAQYAMEDWDRFAWPERVDGLVVAERVEPECFEFVTRSGLPFVLCNSDDQAKADSIVFDDYHGTVLAVEHLLQLGHRRIRCSLLTLDHYSVRLRRQGFIDTMHRAGLNPGEDDMIPTPDEDIESFVDRCLKNGPIPTALLVYSHYQAVNVVKLLHDRGLRVPHDISIATFNNIFPVESTIPALTCVHLPYDDMGRLAARMILDKINGKKDGCSPVILPETLIIRESTAPPRKEN